MIACSETLPRRRSPWHCVRVRAAEYFFLCVCRQPYCPGWGWGFLPARPRCKQRSSTCRTAAGTHLNGSPNSSFFFFLFYIHDKKNQRNRSSTVGLAAPSLSPRPGPLWRRVFSNCCFSQILKCLCVFIFYLPCAVFFSCIWIYLKRP